MIKEAYVSFELAKLLKEKGFDEPCLSYFWSEENNKEISYMDFPFTNKQLYNDQILRPTHQMVMGWLREVHHKHCDIGYDIDLKYYCQIIDLKETIQIDDYEEMKIYHLYTPNYNSYYEAVEAAIKYCLENLI